MPGRISPAQAMADGGTPGPAARAAGGQIPLAEEPTTVYAQRSRLLASLSAFAALLLIPLGATAISSAAAASGRVPHPGVRADHAHAGALHPSVRAHDVSARARRLHRAARSRAALVHGRRDPSTNRTLSDATMRECSDNPS